MCISICAGKTMLEKFYLVISVRVRWGWVRGTVVGA